MRWAMSFDGSASAERQGNGPAVYHYTWPTRCKYSNELLYVLWCKRREILWSWSLKNTRWVRRWSPLILGWVDCNNRLWLCLIPPLTGLHIKIKKRDYDVAYQSWNNAAQAVQSKGKDHTHKWWLHVWVQQFTVMCRNTGDKHANKRDSVKHLDTPADLVR